MGWRPCRPSGQRRIVGGPSKVITANYFIRINSLIWECNNIANLCEKSGVKALTRYMEIIYNYFQNRSI